MPLEEDPPTIVTRHIYWETYLILGQAVLAFTLSVSLLLLPWWATLPVYMATVFVTTLVTVTAVYQAAEDPDDPARFDAFRPLHLVHRRQARDRRDTHAVYRAMVRVLPHESYGGAIVLLVDAPVSRIAATLLRLEADGMIERDSGPDDTPHDPDPLHSWWHLRDAGRAQCDALGLL